MRKLALAFSAAVFILSTSAFATYPEPEPPEPELSPTAEREMLLDQIADERAGRRVMPAEIPARMTAFCRDKTFSYAGFFLGACAFHGGIWVDLKHPIDTPETWKTIREITQDIREDRRQTCADRRRTYGGESPCAAN
jgi:hypothetical protein